MPRETDKERWARLEREEEKLIREAAMTLHERVYNSSFSRELKDILIQIVDRLPDADA